MSEPNIVVLKVRRGDRFLQPRAATEALRNTDTIQVEIADARDRRSVEADPATFASADEMPIMPIKPFQTAQEHQIQETISTWGIKAVQADTSPFNGSGSTVAVLDSGIDLDHPAFGAIRQRIEVQDFTGTGIQDVSGHGTHCAGTIFGQDLPLGEGTLRIGIARDVRKAYVGKIFGGQDTTANLVKAMEWAVSKQSDVISMSVGVNWIEMVEKYKERMPEQAVISSALVNYRRNLRLFDSLMKQLAEVSNSDEGSVVVAASGNESDQSALVPYRVSCSLPAAAEDIISVGALRKTPIGLIAASFSNTNPTISAPGFAVKSAQTGGGLKDMDGTSMACPHAAGVAALWWEAMRSMTPTRRTTSFIVSANLVASVQRGSAVFSPALDLELHGAGLVTAPQAFG